MREALLAAAAVASITGCGYGYETRSTKITGAPMITSGPIAGEPELPRTYGAISERVALEVCTHEARCGRAQTSACLEAEVDKARTQLAGWGCDPASTRARAEECLASIATESCEVDLTQRASVCSVTEACGTANARLVSPGPALGSVWTR